MRPTRLLLASTACALVAGVAAAQTTTTNTTSTQTGAGTAYQPGAAGSSTTTTTSNTTSSDAMGQPGESAGTATGSMNSTGSTNATGSTTGAGGQMATSASAGAPFQRITPSAGADLLTVLKSSGQFTTLIKAITATNLTSVIQRPGSLTVFAPTDAAFAALPAGQLATLMQPANASQLQQFVLLHVVNTPIASAQLLNHAAINVATVATDKKVHLDGSSGTIKVDDSTVLQPDVKASNGTVFVIDKVLSPSYTPPPATAAAATSPAADTTTDAKSTSTTTKSTKRTKH